MRFDWRASGTSVDGPGKTGLIAAAIHSDSPRHVDIGFVLDRTQPKPHILWDCSIGIRRDPDEALVNAIDVWSQVTAPALLELSSQITFMVGVSAPDRVSFNSGHSSILCYRP